MDRTTLARSRTVRVLVCMTLGVGALVALPAAATAATPAAAAALANAPAGSRTAITPGLKGWDSLNVETPAQISCLSNAGYSFDVINTNGTTWQNEYDAAAAAGLKVVLFQGYDPTTWPQATQGTTRGGIAAMKALAAGYPAGAMIFLNVESNLNTTRGNMVTWIRNWTTAVRAKGYIAGVYLGADQILTATDVNSLPGVSVFWKSPTRGLPVPARGYVMTQTSISQSACGINGGIDQDVAGRDGTAAQLIGAAFPAVRATPTQPGTFVPLNPTRLLDTRTGVGARAGAVPTGGHVDLQVTGPLVPNGAVAVVLNVTATAPTSSGNISLTPTGIAPRVSNVNFVAGQTAANLATVRLSPSGKVTLAATVSHSGNVQIIADVAGYYLGGTATAPGAFTPVTPTRLLDTRPHPAARLSTTTVQVAGRAGIPNNGTAAAAVVNLTAVTPAAVGYLTAYSGAGSRPSASNINYVPEQSVPNLAVVQLNSGGRIALFNGSGGSTDLLADVAGYYRTGTPAATGAFVSTRPARILDTRSRVGSSGAVPAGTAIALSVSGAGRVVPAGATAVAINVTVTNTAGLGYLSVFPSDRSAPVASNLNFARGQTVANLVVVPIGADGKIVLDNQSNGTTDLIGDVAGYFVG
jgi:hypothetical protein